MAGKAGFSMVETNLEELNAKIRKHRRIIFIRTVGIVIGIIMAVVLLELWTALRSFDSFEVRNSMERENSSALQFRDFGENIVQYSNDGVVCQTGTGALVWNQAYEMSSPKIDICDNYLAVFDQGGTDLFVIEGNGIKNKIETSMPIKTACVAGQGTVGVLMKEGKNSYIKLYDKNGKELASGEFYGEQQSFPVDIAISVDAKKLAVDMIDISGGKVDTTISFYNFGSVGQNEIDNNVGSFTYEDILIPDIKFVSSKTMLAIGDSKVMIFEGEQKPKLAKEIVFEKEIESVFYNNKYVGYTDNNQDEKGTHHIQVYDLHGNRIMENDTAMAYENIELLSNNEICVSNATECELYTIHSIKKFSYMFDNTLMKVHNEPSLNNYVFVMENEMDEVRLR